MESLALSSLYPIQFPGFQIRSIGNSMIPLRLDSVLLATNSDPRIDSLYYGPVSVAR